MAAKRAGDELGHVAIVFNDKHERGFAIVRSELQAMIAGMGLDRLTEIPLVQPLRWFCADLDAGGRPQRQTTRKDRAPCGGVSNTDAAAMQGEEVGKAACREKDAGME
jgi:hypothetical protein